MKAITTEDCREIADEEARGHTKNTRRETARERRAIAGAPQQDKDEATGNTRNKRMTRKTAHENSESTRRKNQEGADGNEKQRIVGRRNGIAK